MGKTSQESKTMLRCIDYLSGKISSVADTSGEAVNAHVLKPLKVSPQNKPEPFIELFFDGNIEASSVVAFIQGKSFENSTEELPDPYETRLAGRALAGYLLNAQSYPEPHLFPDYHFPALGQEIGRIVKNRQGIRETGNYSFRKAAQNRRCSTNRPRILS